MTRAISVLVFLIIAVVGARQAAAQTTEFTYQGNLDFNGQPATGNYDFEFSLFSAFSGGTQIGQTLAVTNVSVADGVFTVPLNFGSSFPGADRFLEIRVRPAGGGAYTPLTPRQPITSSPYAIKSQSAEMAVNATQLGGVGANQYLTTGTANTNYIRNSATQQASTNFNISGTGTAGIFNANTQFNIGGLRILSKPGNENLIAGENAGSAGVTGLGNSFYGWEAGKSHTSGNNNTFVGSAAGKANISGGANTFIGASAGLVNVVNGANVYVGTSAGLQSTANQNTFLGAYSGYSNTTGSYNTFVGNQAGSLNETGGHITMLGENTNVGSPGLSFATAIGSGAIVTTSNTVVLGRAADTVFAPGVINTQQYNIGGQRVLAAPASANTFVGLNSGQNNSAGFSNTFVGTFAGQTNTGGDENSFFGKDAGISSTGNQNTFIGTDAGQSNTSGSGNSALGAGANVSSGTLTNATAIGAGAVVTFSDTIQLGRDTLDSVRIGRLGSNGITAVCLNGVNGFATCSSSLRYKTNIADFRAGIDVIRRLRPVTFNWTAGNALDLGLVAEEVAGIDPLLVTYNDKGEVEGVKYDRIGVVLINTVKEQQATIDEQRERIELLERGLHQLKLLVCRSAPDAFVCTSKEKK